MAYRLKVVNSGNQYVCETGKSLLNILLSQNEFVENPCGGKGTCGKCKVRIISGNLDEITEMEMKHLTSAELDFGVRLSCMLFPKSDLEIELFQREKNHKILDSGYMPKFEYSLDVTKKLVRISKADLENQISFHDQLLEKLGTVEISTEILQQLHFFETEYTAVIFQNAAGKRQLINLEQGNTTNLLYGVAVDIGTTTVVASLVDLKIGTELATVSAINAQKKYGLDVLTRITYEIDHPETGISELQEAIVSVLNDLIANACEQAHVAAQNIYEISVAANSTMMHMLLGIDATSMGKSPYAPIFTKAQELKAENIGLYAAKGARLYCIPSVSSYIGADIVSGAYVCQLHEAKDNVLFIDIGTNGEIVLSDCGKLKSCSCAAGPALEGMNIREGMRAADGAIEDVKILEDSVELKVIGDANPVGICGSGILAAVRELLKVRILKPNGTFIKLKDLQENDYRYALIEMDGKKRQFKLTDTLRITQGDIRQVQLAKGAILSGFCALLDRAGKNISELDRVIIAGQFGVHLPVDSLIFTGILPEAVRDKLEYVGNSSKTGAYMALMSQTAKRGMEELAQHMEYVELGLTNQYERLFTECLLFPELNSTN